MGPGFILFNWATDFSLLLIIELLIFVIFPLISRYRSFFRIVFFDDIINRIIDLVRGTILLELGFVLLKSFFFSLFRYKLEKFRICKKSGIINLLRENLMWALLFICLNYAWSLKWVMCEFLGENFLFV